MCDLTAALDFLRSHLPPEDLRVYPPELFEQFARHALELRKTVPWCGALEEEIFLHYVLFPRVNDEDLSFHRQLFFDALWPRVRDLPAVEDAVLEVNRWCHEIASYQQTDARTASPLTVWRSGSGRCGEESAFLVSALRSVGIPARQVYVPRWSHCDDNHAWVEALCGDTWRFLGACEPEPVLDRGWFNASASRALLVHSRLFGAGASPLHGQPVGREGNVTFYNQTARYAPTSERVFRVLSEGRPVPGAVLQLQVLNESHFCTVATLTANAEGQVRVPLGPGTVHVLALSGALRAEGDSDGGDLTLRLSPAGDADTPWTDFAFRAAQPAPVNPSPLDASQRALRARVREEGAALRRARVASFFSPDPAHPAWDSLLAAARGNGGELLAFLRDPGAPARERLVRTLAPKDLRDTDAVTLEDHFTHLPPQGNLPDDIYWPYVANPRIALEKIVPWRSGVDVLPEGPARTVAALRGAGIPARLRPLDGAPERWEKGVFRPLVPEDTAALHLLSPEAPPYWARWALSRRTAGGWQVLDLSDRSWQGGHLCAALPAGQFRLTSSTRLPGGDQLAARTDFTLRPGEERTIPLRLRTCPLERSLFRMPMPPTPAAAPDGTSVPDVFRLDGRPSLLCWLDEGAEPTEHLLNELAALRDDAAALPLNVVFLLRGPEALRQSTLAALLSEWPAVRVLLDDWAFDLEDLARRLALDPEAPPLAIVCDGSGQAVYADCGYRVGAAELLLRAAKTLL